MNMKLILSIALIALVVASGCVTQAPQQAPAATPTGNTPTAGNPQGETVGTQPVPAENTETPVPETEVVTEQPVPGTDTPDAEAIATVPEATAPATYVVRVTQEGFEPSTLSIRQGDTVVWTNTVTRHVWVASDPHPVHTNYPTTGGCIGSTFDSCGEMSIDQNFSFTFNEAGSWGYHDHTSPGMRGTIIVEAN